MGRGVVFIYHLSCGDPALWFPWVKASRDHLQQARAVAIFVSGERRRPTEALKPAALWPTSPRDRIQEIRGGPQWEGRREGGGGKGAAAAAAHTGSVLGAARTEGGSAGEVVPARTPRGSLRTDRGPGGGAWSDSEGLVSGGGDAQHLPEARTSEVPWGRPSDPRPRRWACCGTAGVGGAWLGLWLLAGRGKYLAAGGLRRACRGGCARPDAPNAPRPRGEGVAAGWWWRGLIAISPRGNGNDAVPPGLLDIIQNAPLRTGLKSPIRCSGIRAPRTEAGSCKGVGTCAQG